MKKINQNIVNAKERYIKNMLWIMQKKIQLRLSFIIIFSKKEETVSYSYVDI